MNTSLFRCPTCHKKLDELVSVTPYTYPEVGDGFVCGNCGTIGEFVKGGVRKMSDKDLRNLSPEEQAGIDFAKQTTKPKKNDQHDQHNN